MHLAVVDPGVGTDRRAIALEDKSGRLYVGPDNGLLLPAAERMGGVVRAHQITNPAFAMEEIAPTFHGRDVFSPAAAHLALGVPLEEMGPSLEMADLVRLDIPKPETRRGRVRAVVVDTDRFGNMQLNLRHEHLETLGISVGTKIEIEHGGERYYAITARTFSDARRGRHHALRGLVPESRRRHLGRRCGDHVRRRSRATRSSFACATGENGLHERLRRPKLDCEKDVLTR